MFKVCQIVAQHQYSYYDNYVKEAIQGAPVSEEQVAVWVEEAEAGYDVDALRKRGRGRPGRGASPSQVVAVRFTPEELSELDQRAAAQNISRSALIREAVLV